MSFKRLMLIISVVVGTVFAGNATARTALSETKKESSKRYNHDIEDGTSRYEDTSINEIRKLPQKEKMEDDLESAVLPRKSGGTGSRSKPLSSGLK